MIKQLFLCVCCSLLALSGYSQQKGPSTISQGTFIKKTIALRDFPTIDPNVDRGLSEIKVVDNNLSTPQKVSQNALPFGAEPNAQLDLGRSPTFGPQVNFDGINITEAGGFTPPDPTGAVGPNHYIHAVNVALKIFDKSGGLLVGPTSLGEFLGNGQNNGDPILMYDQLADRYFVSQFQSSDSDPTLDNILVIGVSETPDPTGAYFLYQFQLDQFPDYPHYTVWHDAYYMTANTITGETTFALERDVMLAGGQNPQIIGFDLPEVINSPDAVFSPEPAHLIGTDFTEGTPGYIVYLQDDGWSDEITFDHLKVWEIDIDFDIPSNSTISDPLEIPTEPFDSVFRPFGQGDIEQPGTDQRIDGIGGVISYAANYRQFEDHNSWLVTFNVDVNGQDRAGVRWTELRNEATTDWTIFQQGTYAPDDNNSRFMGSGAIDRFGNIGLAFNIGGPETPVGISYTGRFIDDPLGQMTIDETIIVDGIGVQTDLSRFGDYSHLTMDPDDLTFWHTAEYFPSDDFWSSRIASFQITGQFSNDIAVTDIIEPNAITGLSNNEIIATTIRNVGLEEITTDILELRLDGVLVATETLTTTLAPNEATTYTFNQTLDLSVPGQEYEIEVTAIAAGDEESSNNSFSEIIRNPFLNDIGITEFVGLESGFGLSETEPIIVSITNFGSLDQTGFDLQYVLNNENPIIETFTGLIEAGTTIEYTFNTTADLSSIGNMLISSKTNLVNDQDITNDEISIEIDNAYCIPESIACGIDGIKRFVLNTIDADDGGNDCNTEPDGSPLGYADRTNLSTTLINVAGFNEYILQAQQNFEARIGREALSVWIDFNDNGGFESSEQLISGQFFTQAAQLEPFDLVIPVGAPLGEHRLRVKAIDTVITSDGDIDDPCSNFFFGEVQDYTVFITDEVPTTDIGVTAITSPVSDTGLMVEDVTVEITNFGDVIQDDFDVQYLLNDQTPVVESISGGVDAGEVLEYTFTQGVDLTEPDTYTLEVRTLLENDEDLTNDATSVTIEATLGIDDVTQNQTKLSINSNDNVNFEVRLETPFEGIVYVSLINMLGQKLTYKPIARDGNGFKVNLDLSELSSGIYILKVNDLKSSFIKTSKIIKK